MFGLYNSLQQEVRGEDVDSVDNCDVIFTNDVYPENVLSCGKRKIKRMDGVFWQEDFKERNEKYNLAAEQSDHVIFISEYSKKSFETLYKSQIENCSVITHWVEKKFDYFYDCQFNNTFFSMATDWNRKEKRLSEIVKFVELTGCKINLVGKCEYEVPENITKFGYLEPDSIEFLSVIKQSSAFLNLTCKDAATKTVCQAINYGLPVLFSNSGGVSELVLDCGVGIKEEEEIDFLKNVPELKQQNIIFGFEQFVEQYAKLKDNIDNRMKDDLLMIAVGKYFEIIKGEITNENEECKHH